MSASEIQSSTHAHTHMRKYTKTNKLTRHGMPQMNEKKLKMHRCFHDSK